MNEYIQTSGLTPIGTIIHFMGTKTPEGYLFCDGSTYNITDYPEFCDFLVDQFGSVNHFGGDGVDTFAVPDLRGEFLRGTGTNSHTRGGNGADVGVHQIPTTIPYEEHYANTNYNCGVGRVSIQNYDSTQGSNIANVYTGKKSSTSSFRQSVTIRPTNTSVHLCIKVK